MIYKRSDIISIFNPNSFSSICCDSHTLLRLIPPSLVHGIYYYQRDLELKRLPVMSDSCVVCWVAHWLPAAVVVVSVAVALSVLETEVVR